MYKFNKFNKLNKINKKRKYNMIHDNIKKSHNYDSDIDEDIDVDDDMKGKLINNLFGFNNDDDVYLEHNHIYFKTDVTMESVDKLCKLIREYKYKFNDIKKKDNICDITPKPLYIHLTTYGGDLYAAIMCYDIIKSSSIPIYTIAEGYTASAGTIISVAGQKRYITQNTVFMIHQLRTGMGGKYEELMEEMQNSKKDMDRIVNIYHTESKGKMTKIQIKEQLKHDKWFDSKESIKYGLVDEIYNDY